MVNNRHYAFKKSIISDMHHRKTYMYIYFQKNRVSRSVKSVHTIFLLQKRKLHEFATTSSNFAKIDYFRHESSDNVRTCISIYSQIGLVDQSKPCTQIARGIHTNIFAKNRKLHKFATTNSNFAKINYFRYESSDNVHVYQFSAKLV